MKVIMVPVADRPECRVALESAFRLAASLSANIVGYHLRPHREERRGSNGAHLAVLLEGGELPERSPADIRLNSVNAEKLFRAMAGLHGIPVAGKPRVTGNTLAFWNEMVGTPEKLFSIIGPTADCIVLSRPRPRGSGPARAFMLSALLRSGRPLLVLPQKPGKHSASRILIAWNQGVQAALAVSAALPLLQRAEQVHLVCSGKESLPGPKMAHARNYLSHWGVESHLHHLQGHDASAEILAAYKQMNCGLLVMGAYSRGHLRERILGGVTHEMLFKANVPVFTLHA
ncbi:MAG TPA: universal stress protein [Xanthomonadales bacterium]|nr:universal stress protein [Xanthomonadales bacterium]